MELGLYTFVENTPNAVDGTTIHPAERLSNLMEEIKLADKAGLDVFAIGEHHRKEFVSSSPATILAAAASITEQIKLSSSVTVLGSEDPVRVFQQFATIDLLSKGRAEIIVGRGSFIESFPLFGYDLNNYEELFEEKLDLLLQLREEEQIIWQGKYRSSINDLGIFPQPFQKEIPIWRAVGGTPKSAYVTGALGLPLAIAIIGGRPAQFKRLADLHEQGAKDHDKPKQKVSINSHGFIADSSQEASNSSYPAFKQVMDQLGRERGWPPMSRDQFNASTTLEAANFVGSPQEVIDKIMYQHEVFNHDRFLMQMTVGSISHLKVMRSIELFATKVAPVVRKELGILT